METVDVEDVIQTNRRVIVLGSEMTECVTKNVIIRTADATEMIASRNLLLEPTCLLAKAILNASDTMSDPLGLFGNTIIRGNRNQITRYFTEHIHFWLNKSFL